MSFSGNSNCPPTMFLQSTKLINSRQIRSCNLGCFLVVQTEEAQKLVQLSVV